MRHGATRTAVAALMAIVPGLVGIIVASPSAGAEPSPTVLVSATPSGHAGAGGSDRPHISGDGRVVGFDSQAADLVGSDGNGVKDVFVRDLAAGTIERVSVSSSDGEGDDASTLVTVDETGRYVAFQSLATNLVPGDDNDKSDIFVRDRSLGTTTLVSIDRFGGFSNGTDTRPTISGDGRWIAWNSAATDLVAGDTNGLNDIFVRDLVQGVTTRIVAMGGAEPNGVSIRPEISDDGRWLLFESYADNLVPGDGNGGRDVFLHDLVTGQTERASVDQFGGDLDGDAFRPHLSGDGSRVVYQTYAADAVPGDFGTTADVIVRDMASDENVLVSQSSSGHIGAGQSTRGVLSGDGRFVVFSSYAANLVDRDWNGQGDVFIRDLLLGTTQLVSTRAGSTAGANGWSYRPEISDDGSIVAFRSAATDLVENDTNNNYDIFAMDVTHLQIDPGAPDASVAAPTPGAEYVVGAVRIEGTATAEAGIASVHYVLRDTADSFYLQPDGSFGPGWIRHAAILDQPGQTLVAWNADLTLAAGTYELQVIAEDTIGVRDPIKPVIVFAVLDKPPDTRLASPADGAVFTTRNIVVNGSAFDDIGIVAVAGIVKHLDTGRYLQPDGSLAAGRAIVSAQLGVPGATQTNWWISARVPDGRYAVSVWAIDSAEQADPGRLSVRFAVELPTPVIDATLSTPAHGSALRASSVLLAGRATDAESVLAVQVILRDRTSGDYVQRDGRLGPNRRKLRAVLVSPGAPETRWWWGGTLPDGDYRVQVVAINSARERDSSPAVSRFTLTDTPDTAAPTLVNNAPVIDPGGGGATVELSGRATDDRSVAAVLVIVKNKGTGRYLGSDGSFAATRTRLPAVLVSPHTPASDWRLRVVLPRGDYSVQIFAKDAVGTYGPKSALTVAV